MKNTYDISCNIAQTLNIIGDRWTLLILRQLMVGRHTYKEIQEHLEGIPSNLLSSRLKSLEKDELIYSNLYQKHPPRYQYFLTERGKDLGDVFHSIILWGERNLTKCHKRLIHSECQHRIELQYFCPKCHKVIDRDEIETKE